MFFLNTYIEKNRQKDSGKAQQNNVHVKNTDLLIKYK